MLDDETVKELQDKLHHLVLEHSDLDDVIQRLSDDPTVDQIRLRRLKKRKLLLKDIIASIRSQLIPDIEA